MVSAWPRCQPAKSGRPLTAGMFCCVFVSVEHRLWLKEPPVAGSAYAAELPFDDDFEIRAHAARRLWRALNGRPAGPAFHELSPQRRQRLALALRALDAQS